MNIDEQKLEQFVFQVFGDLSVSASSVMVSIGHKLGLYRAMMDAGPINPEQLAVKTDCAPRYVREWLNSQVASGYLDYDAKAGTYELGPEQAMVLAKEDSPVFLPTAWSVTACMWLDEDKALQAFRTGEGVAWGDHAECLFNGTAAFFRNGYRQNLVANWLPALSGVVERLQQGIAVADVGCGYGHSSMIMAEAFPQSRFFGFDNHGDSIKAAKNIAAEQGLAERTRFSVASAKDYPNKGFGLICFFDCLHDMGDPLGAARHARACLDEQGCLMLVEPNAGDAVEDNINPVGRMFYSASTSLCCAHSLSEEVGTALGAQAGEKRLTALLQEAGFGTVRRVAETPFNMILEARP